MGYARIADRRVQLGAVAAFMRALGARLPDSWSSASSRASGYNPQLRSTLFLVPGLIAYISMITAVVSTAAVGRAREGARHAWSRCGWRRSARCRTSSARRCRICVISFVSALLVILVGDAAVRSADARLVAAAVPAIGAVPGRRAGAGLLISTDRRNPAGGLPGGACCHRLLPTMILSGFIFPITSMPIGGAVDHTHRRRRGSSSGRLRSCVLKGADHRWPSGRSWCALAIFATVAWPRVIPVARRHEP